MSASSDSDEPGGAPRDPEPTDDPPPKEPRDPFVPGPLYRATTFRQLLEHFEESARTQAAKGRRFEDFCASFLRVDPYWSEHYDTVWLWQDWPGRGARPDTGIDLVARVRGTGELVAIQCKFYKPSAVLSWDQLSTFAAMLAQEDFTSGMIISTAGSESPNLHRNLDLSPKPIVWWRVEDFEESRVDWEQFRPTAPTEIPLKPTKSLRDHQRAAVDDVVEGFETQARGQLVMACGTGKTLTSLRLAEELIGSGGSVLFLVPSINLLSQSVLAWANDAQVPLSTFAVCSDVHAGRRRDEDMSANDLQFPASTDADSLVKALALQTEANRMTVVFSTYQSIDVIASAQRVGLGSFDLIICDEAHRTTGSYRTDDEQSAFTKVHDDAIVGGDRRLYMTATPKVYGDQTKAKARAADVVVASMDDETRFGPVFHELPFGKAVAADLLTDYKVLVLAVNEDAVSDAFQREFAAEAGELPLSDVARMVGCWHGLSKRGPQFQDDNIPMRRAVAFSSTIKQSKRFASALPNIVAAALEDRSDRNAIRVEATHVDGSTNVKVRSEAIAWLEEPPGQRVARVLSNAKCLTEGVDVPALDAVMFLNPRKSVVDVVQAVGRVMRKLEGKDYGYVILPIGVPGNVPPEEALRDSDKYQVVWQVLQALRSHDERLAAEINKIDINKTSSQINVIGIGMAGGDDPESPGVTTTAGTDESKMALALPDLNEWRDALYARVVDKVGDRRYMEHWAADISEIARAQETRIRSLLEHPDQHPDAVSRFADFTTALRHNLNDSITDDDAIGMLSQHLITRPVFEALFGGDEFTRKNPVSQVMQSMLDTLDATNIASEVETLEGFYDHIQMLIGGIDTAAGRQRVITELYEKFFKKALPRTADSLGIVYTPIEVVDYINRAVNDLLHRHFDGASLSDEHVHILDPFAGTGTFITRLLQTGQINRSALIRKYQSELHANELMLLGYYIAAINIETVYRGLIGPDDYQPFEGIVLTDTFQLSEEGDPMDAVFFPHNNARADRQKQLDIRVIIGNPPYSVGQSSQNEDNQNLKYPTLDHSIERSYAALSTATNKNSLYDSYIRAFRWASDRIETSPHGGVIGFVTNGGWLDGKTADGMRRALAREFHYIYVFNLRGNALTTGEIRRRESDNVFGQGSKTTIAITLLVRGPGNVPPEGANIVYRDIGDYLKRPAKLSIIDESTIDSGEQVQITPNAEADWINQRDPRFDRLLSLAGERDSIFKATSNGLQSNRDAWAYSSSLPSLRSNVDRMVEFFNSQLDAFKAEHPDAGQTLRERTKLAKEFVDKDPSRHSWDRDHFRRIARGDALEFTDDMLREALYRPFLARNAVLDRSLNVEVSKCLEMFPRPGATNRVIGVVGTGTPVPFATLATNRVPDVVLFGAGSNSKFYPRWTYLDDPGDALFQSDAGVSNINPAARATFQSLLGDDVDEDAIFYYVYGVLHSPDFRKTFAANLRKDSPRVPMVTSRDLFDVFSVAGSDLFELHAGYEAVDPYELEEEWVEEANPGAREPSDVLLIGRSRMKHPERRDPTTGERFKDLTRLQYNSYLTLAGIPLEAYEYRLGSRSVIDWIIDRYHVSTDPASGIVNDPNQWGIEHDDPWYIIELIKRAVTVSIRTVDIIKSLPPLDFDRL